jgi:putative addiction module antidote
VRIKETAIRPIGNSAGVTIPKDMLEHFDLEAGDRVCLQQTPDGILISAYDAAFLEAMAVARRGMKKYRNALRELSTR